MREPDLILRRESGGIYLKRWWIIPRNRFLNLYLHQFLGSDDDRALHDHPWWFVSWIVKGEYIEHTPSDVVVDIFDTGYVHHPLTDQRTRHRWSMAFRPAKWAHRVQLIPEILPDRTVREKPVWTVILTGPKIRTWGFYCPQGWITWMKFDKQNGCGE